MRRTHRTPLSTICAAGFAFAALLPGWVPAAGNDTPRRGGFVQEESVRLILLDVVVKDEQGRAMPGLKKEDFDLRLDFKRWPVYSVDDFCRGSGGPAGSSAGSTALTGAGRYGPAGLAASPVPAREAGHAGAAAGSDSGSMRYVLYFDFSQLRLLSRRQAIRAAIRWVDEVKRPDEEAMIEAYVEKTGLRTLVPFTRDSAVLRTALESSRDDPALIDDFPDLFRDRIDECVKCFKGRLFDPGSCIARICEPNATDEYQHGKRSLEALEQFMGEMGEEPGRKSVIFMHENTFLSPGEFYPIPAPESRIGTHGRLLEAVGAEATSSRAALYPAYFGESLLDLGAVDQALEAGQELAGFTGGSSSRAGYVSFDTMKKAGRESSCTYRIAFAPPEEAWTRTHHLAVRAAGRRISYDYRVKFVSDAEHLMRRARKVLRDPAAHKALGVTAALVPLDAGGSRWSAKVQVALDLKTLELVPSGRGQAGHVDVGALLENEKTGKTWEMLAGSDVRLGPVIADDSVILYETSLAKIEAGAYRLRAFVHDKDLDLYGAAEARLDLPKAGGGALVGPFGSCPHRNVFSTALPLHGSAVPAGIHLEAAPGASPFEGEVVRGERILLSSLICSPEEIRQDANLIRLVEQDGRPLFRLPAGWVEEGEECRRFTDLLDTIELSPGAYTYRLIWISSGGTVPVSRAVAFRVKSDPAWLTRLDATAGR